jgi:NAD+ diphosphatase
VIVLVHDGVAGAQGRCLLGRNAAWQPVGGVPRYSCLAGFVEPGESAEQAVIREIHEEVGVDLSDVRYVASQPWPFPGSLMLGFFALGDPEAEIRLDDDEITDARWFTRAEIASVLAGDQSFALPMGVSIARYLIAEWASAELASPGRPSGGPTAAEPGIAG